MVGDKVSPGGSATLEQYRGSKKLSLGHPLNPSIGTRGALVMFACGISSLKATRGKSLTVVALMRLLSTCAWICCRVMVLMGIPRKSK